MPWVRFDDQFPIHRKTAGLSDAAFRLHVAAIFWCARNLTDGFLPDEDLADVCARVRTPARFAAECVDRGAWHPRGESCESENCIAPVDEPGWVIHDYLEYQFSKEQVIHNRERGKERQKRYRDARNGVHNAVTNAVANAYPGPDPGPDLQADVVDRANGGSGARASPELTEAVIQEIYDATSRVVDPAWAGRIAAELLRGRDPDSPVAYVRQAIRNDPDPRKRFLPLY